MKPSIDLETYSEAGYRFVDGKRKTLKGAAKLGIRAVGAAVYARHPTAEILMAAYNIGHGVKQWVLWMPPPLDLFAYLARGGVLNAWNDSFEWEMWSNVAAAKMGWPAIRREQLIDSAGIARAWGLPGKLEKAAEVLDVPIKKDKDGARLIEKFSCPRSETKHDKRRRILLADDLPDALNYCSYNVDDVHAEAGVVDRCPMPDAEELKYMQLTGVMNARGVAIDVPGVEACIATLETEYMRANARLATITGGAVESATQGGRMRDWLATMGVKTKSLDKEARPALLAGELPDAARKALIEYDLVCASGPRKVFTMQRMACDDGRLRNMYMYHGARTGRDSAVDVQPQNLVKAGHPWIDGRKWTHELTDEYLRIFKAGKAHEVFRSPVLAVSGCIRSLFIAAEGHDLIDSDYSSIEAVVTACLAREQWRIDAFKRGEDIYLHGAAGITGHSYEWYAQNGGKKHPDRQNIGKPAELGLGFGGWFGAWRQFDDTDNFDDDQVKRNIIAWREKSPAIVEFWGGQVRGKPWRPDRYERFGLEGAAIDAVERPGVPFTVNGYITYMYHPLDDVLYCTLPSGRRLAYHRPRLSSSNRWDDPYQLSLSFEGWNSNPKKGATGWVRMGLYGGLLCENVVQAAARDVLRRAVINAEDMHYPIVLRTHDQLTAEVPHGFGSIPEFEEMMADLPSWARGWPIRAAGGWRGKRFRKD